MSYFHRFVVGTCRGGLLAFLLCVPAYAAGQNERAVFLRGSEVWRVNLDGSELKQLTRDGARKDHPVCSPDGGRVAYLTASDPTKNHVAKVVIINEQGTVLQTIPVPAESDQEGSPINSVLKLEWVGDNAVAVEGHINPSLSEYRIVQLDGGATKSYYGALFRWSPDGGKLAQLEWMPHFAPRDQLSQRVQVNGQVVYTLPKDALNNRVSSELVWSPDSMHLAFVQADDIQQTERLVILDGEGRATTSALPASLKRVERLVWLDNDAVLLGKGNVQLLYGYGTKRLQPLDEKTRTRQAAYTETEGLKERIISALKGRSADWCGVSEARQSLAK